MPETRESLLQHYTQMRAELTASIEGLTDAQMAEPTIDSWSVKDNLAHIALWDDLRADEVTRISAGFESALRMTGEQDEVLNTLVHDLRHDLSLAQVRWELAHSLQHLSDAIRAASDRALEGDRYGEAGLRSTHAAEHAGYIRNWRQRLGI